MKLTGQRNQCQGCKEYFRSNYAFDKHRTGLHCKGTRRCLTPEEMLAKGMVKNAAGFWVSSARTTFGEKDEELNDDNESEEEHDDPGIDSGPGV